MVGLFKSYLKNQQGFTYPELIVVSIISVFIVFFSIPIYRKYSAAQEIRNTSILVREQIRLTHSKSTNGVKPANGLISNWAISFNDVNNSSQFQTAACPIVTDPLQSGYVNRYNFGICENRSSLQTFSLPAIISVTHQISGENQVNLFFASINGDMTVYDQTGNEIGDSVDIVIASSEYPDMRINIKVNSKGDVTQEEISGL